MRIFQSLWTKPALDKRWDTSGQLEANIWLYTLSAVYAKQLGVTLVLYTDSLGAQLLKHLPYDEVYTILDKIPSNIPSMVWAYGKFVALQKEPMGSIHIDGDVFLKKPEMLEQLDFSEYDLIVQNKEHLSPNNYINTENKLDYYKVVNKDFFTTDYAVNCGVVGFNNFDLKYKYLVSYFRRTGLLAQLKPLREYMSQNKYFCVDLPLEQHSLAVLSEESKVKYLLGEWWGSDTSEKAASIGYQHLIGKDKYNYIERVKFTLLALDKDIYYKTKKVIDKHKNILI